MRATPFKFGLYILCSSILSTALACSGDAEVPDLGSAPDTGATPIDSGTSDLGTSDAGPSDTGFDAGSMEDLGAPEDTGPQDLGDPGMDAGVDLGPVDAGSDLGIDAGPDDVGPQDLGTDLGPGDTGPEDQGDPDLSTDGGPGDGGNGLDGGAPDAGPTGCPIGDEGCLCGFGLTCNDPALTCLDTSNGTLPGPQRIHVCVRECTNDLACLASIPSNTLCRPVFFGTQACVSAEVDEGRTIDMSRRRGPPMTGCAPGLVALPDYVGFGLEQDQGSCGRPCDPNAMVGGLNGCNAQYPYCNPDILNSPITPGICSLRAPGPGDTCSRSSAVLMCDSAPATLGTSGRRMQCLGLPEEIFDATDPSDEKLGGICAALCDLALPDCGHVSDPGIGPASCRAIGPSNPTLGFCSNDCNDFPNNCMNPSAFGNGSQCTGDILLNQGFTFSFCRAVNPPVIPEWDWTTAPANRCLNEPGGETRCEAGTRCFNDNLGGVCVRPCTTSSTITGCAQGINSTCDPTRIGVPTDGLGLCIP